jgi:hypothetical protein
VYFTRERLRIYISGFHNPLIYRKKHNTQEYGHLTIGQLFFFISNQNIIKSVRRLQYKGSIQEKTHSYEQKP